MAVSSKGKRKVTVLGRQYFWYVEDAKPSHVPEEGFVSVGEPARYLHIFSNNKRFIVHYRLPHADDGHAMLEVEGPDFPRAPESRVIEVPRWRHDTKRYPTADFVRRLIGWCLGLE